MEEAGAAAIALDIYQAITPEEWLRTLDTSTVIPPEISDYDQTFDQALSEGHVILAANPIHDMGKIPVPLPAEEYLAALPNHLNDVGLTILPRDTDGKIRRMVLALEGLPTGLNDKEQHKIPEGYQTPNPWWTFAALAVKVAYGEKALTSFRSNSIFSPSLINYCGPPKTIPRISLAALFREQGLTPEERSLISGRIVFIGADNENFGDHQQTPYSQSFFGYGGKRDMSGAEIHANIAETILNPKHLQNVPLAGVFLLWGSILSLAAVACELKIKPMAVYVMKTISLLILWPIGFIAFKFGYLLPQAGCFFSIMVFFISIAILRTLGAHDRTAKKISKVAFNKIYHDRRDRRRTDAEISTGSI